MARLNVGLSDFSVETVAVGVRLTWTTETELDTAGFRIARTEGTETVFLTDIGEDGFVAGRGGVTQGADYEAIDTAAVFGQTYTYELYEVGTDNSQVAVAHQEVLVQFPTPTRPIALSTAAPPETQPTAIGTTVAPTSASIPPAGPSAISTPAAAGAAPLVPTAAAPAEQSLDPAEAGAGASGGGSLSRAGGDGALAQEAVPVTAQDPYPPAATTAAPGFDFAAPGAAQPTPAAYPPAEEGSIFTPVPIGSQPEADPAQGIVGSPVEQPVEESGGQGLLYLWLGFIATLLIFGTSVVGAAILFTRRNES